MLTLLVYDEKFCKNVSSLRNISVNYFRGSHITSYSNWLPRMLLRHVLLLKQA